MLTKIFNKDQREYHNKEENDDSEHLDFEFIEVWEIEYPIKIIKKIYPKYSEVFIRNPISNCCRLVVVCNAGKEIAGCDIHKLCA